MRIAEIQEALRAEGLDGWLFCDHHRRDPLAYRVLGLDPTRVPTRRWYYLIRATEDPVGLVHRIERDVLDGLPGARVVYAGWQEQWEALRGVLRGCRRVAMQYSRHGAIPQVSLVDAGTVELVRDLGVEVVSAADLIQLFEARWTQEALALHLEAGRLVDRIREEAFRWLSERRRSGEVVREYAVKQFLLDRFREHNLCTEHGPIVAAGRNSSLPHYEPEPHRDREIEGGEVVLMDVWAKLDCPGAVYCDFTWVGFCGHEAPDRVREIFYIVKGARDRALALVERRVAAGEVIRGYEVDDEARGYIQAKGYGACFTHRTGHSIGVEVHGAGANMDNLETHDERRIIPWTCFSIEPGIYLEDFGIRSEIDVFVTEREVKVTGEVQQEIVLI